MRHLECDYRSSTLMFVTMLCIDFRPYSMLVSELLIRSGVLSPSIVLPLSLHFPDDESRGDCVAQIISSGGEHDRSDKSSVPT